MVQLNITESNTAIVDYKITNNIIYFTGCDRIPWHVDENENVLINIGPKVLWYITCLGSTEGSSFSIARIIIMIMCIYKNF